MVALSERGSLLRAKYSFRVARLEGSSRCNQPICGIRYTFGKAISIARIRGCPARIRTVTFYVGALDLGHNRPSEVDSEINPRLSCDDTGPRSQTEAPNDPT